MRADGTLARIYANEDLEPGKVFPLRPDQTHYVLKVLRLGVGDDVRVFNADYGEWACEISSVLRREVILNPRRQLRAPVPVPDITLAFGLLKKPRLATLVEKATEMGAAELVPLITQRVQFPKLSLDKSRAQIIEAAEQTERMDIPPLREAQNLNIFLENLPNERALIFADEAGDAAPALNTLQNATLPLTCLVGPEGGFTDKERAQIRAHPNARPVTLGPRILRAETAAIALLTLAQAASGDWA